MCSGLWSGFHDPAMGEHRMVRVTRQRKQERPEAKAALTFGECSRDPSAPDYHSTCCEPDAGNTAVRRPQSRPAGGGWRGAERSPAEGVQLEGRQRCPALSSGNLQKGVRCEACLESSRQDWGAVAGR